MAETLFDQATSISALHMAFSRVHANRGAPGGDGETTSSFAAALEHRISSLHWALTQHHYRPGPLRHVDIPKRTSGTRRLSIPCVTDRVVQTALAIALTPLFEAEFEDSSYAYRAGKSVQQAVARVSLLRRQGYPWVVDGDIRAFFDEVPHAPLLARIDALVGDPDVLDLIRWTLAGFSPVGRGLAQGSPLSPLLANLWLDGLDEQFAEGPVRIVRFADDFVLLSKSHKSAEAALHRAEAWLAEHGLVLHPGKTRIVPFEQAFDFLGHLFVRSVVVAQERDEPCPPSRLPNALGPRSLSSPAMRDDGPAAEEEALAAAVLGQADLPDASALADDPLADLARDRDAGDFAAGLAPLYLVEPGRRLGVAHDCFTVSGGVGEAAQELLRIPAPLVGRIDIGPDARAGDEALRMAAVHGVPVSFVNGLGAAQAVLLPANSDMGGLHLAQASLTLDPARALAQAQILVTAKIANGRALLKRLNRRRKKEAVEAACAALKQVGRRAAVSMTLDKLRGMEGEAARLYWPALGACLEHGFALKRRRDDPANPVTAVLDFTAHLLTRDMVAAVLRSGLHPGFGVLHMSGDRREPAAWDLIEAFRAPLSEGLAVYLFNNRILQAADFVARAGGADKPGNGLRLTGAGSRALIEGYEGWMARPVRNRRTGNDTTWRGLLLSECRAFASALRSGAAFAPYRLDY